MSHLKGTQLQRSNMKTLGNITFFFYARLEGGKQSLS